jgi:hypothetical protein
VAVAAIPADTHALACRPRDNAFAHRIDLAHNLMAGNSGIAYERKQTLDCNGITMTNSARFHADSNFS